MGWVMSRTKVVPLHLIEDDGHTPVEPINGTDTQACLSKKLGSGVHGDGSSVHMLVEASIPDGSRHNSGRDARELGVSHMPFFLTNLQKCMSRLMRGKVDLWGA
jgi:hypothetical protein